MIARRFALLAEPMRLRLLHALFEGEKPVNALVTLSGGTQANVSRHLQALAEAGIFEPSQGGAAGFLRDRGSFDFQVVRSGLGRSGAGTDHDAEAFGHRAWGQA